MTSVFFLIIKYNFAFQKELADCFLVKPWPNQQPPEAKLLISVCLLKGQKCKFYASFHMSYSLLECTEVRYASSLSGGFITAIVVNPQERNLAKRTSMDWVEI